MSLDSHQTKGCLERTNLCIQISFIKGFGSPKGNTSKAAQTWNMLAASAVNIGH